jgi:ribosomal protein L37AE/L43A
MNWIQRLMYGRYGNDPLNYTLLVLYLVLCLIAQLLNSSVLSLIAFLCVILAFYRAFSRQLDRRRGENAKFMSLVGPMIRKYNVAKCRRRDKEHRYFKCPNCGQQLRVPRGKGKISITCRNCGVSFEEKT